MATLSPTPPHLSSPQGLVRNASTSSARSTTTCSSTSSVQAAPMRPPPKETSTAATSRSQLPSRNQSESEGEAGSRYNGPGLSVGGRGGWGRNGPRSNVLGSSPQARHVPPALIHISASSSPSPILTSSRNRQSNYENSLGLAPTTPGNTGDTFAQQQDFSPHSGPRVTISVDPSDQLSHDYDAHDRSRSRAVSPVRGRSGHLTAPSSPTSSVNAELDGKPRTLSVDAGSSRPRVRSSLSTERERRQSQLSTTSSSGNKRLGPSDYIIGEELGQGSYSTVYEVIYAPGGIIPPATYVGPRKFAMKVINQIHLVQEKKVKYAMVERDALIRLIDPKSLSLSGPGAGKGHKRGLSSSSSAGLSQGTGGKKKGGGAGGKKENRDRISIVTTSSDASSPILTASSASTQLSPVSGSGANSKSLAGRRPSRSADPPESVPEQSETPVEDKHFERREGRSRPPSPVREESTEGHESEKNQKSEPAVLDLDLGRPVSVPPPAVPSTPEMRPNSTVSIGEASSRTSKDQPRPQSTPKRRRQSLAPSEKSTKSNSSPAAHPGIIKLHTTFNDNNALYFILSLAENGELATFIRKYGSLDLNSARYYAAQLLDTIEYMHFMGVIHRDIKPENILLDEAMRMKITDFGSAKIIGRVEANKNGDEARKRSFVGSADFVSPEVLRNEEVTAASDVWAFGCIVYQFLVGKPPFRGATDYLTFQRILRREMEFPEGFDEQAKNLVDMSLNLDPTQRPTAQSLKAHPFFSSTDFTTLWTIPAPQIATGLKGPTPMAQLKAADVWGVFEGSDVEGGDGGFGYDDEYEEPASRDELGFARQDDRAKEPFIDRRAAASAVSQLNDSSNHQRTIDISFSTPRVSTDTEHLDPPRPAYATQSMGKQERKSRGWSHGSSSSGNRNALAGWLEAIRLGGGGGGMSGSGTSAGTSVNGQGHGHGPSFGHGHGFPSHRGSKSSMRSEELRNFPIPGPIPAYISSNHHPANSSKSRYSSILFPTESIIFSSPILARTTASSTFTNPSSISSSIQSHLPGFLLGALKKRVLVLTDFPRLVILKDDNMAGDDWEGKDGKDQKEGMEEHSRNSSMTGMSSSQGQLGQSTAVRIKGEAVFVPRPSAATASSATSTASHGPAGGEAPPNRVVEVQEKGSKAFVVHTLGTIYYYSAESKELRDRWMSVIRQVNQ